jgi:hypothetical protein
MAELTVKWDKMGDEFTYDVLYSNTPNGPWTKHNLIRLYDDILSDTSLYNTEISNIYVLTDLDADRTYYVKVICHDKYNSWWIGYEDIESIGGGFGHDEDAPESPFNNAIGIKITVG